MMTRDIRQQKRRRVSKLSGTVRTASIVQKSIKTGRSSYVEMRSVSRTFNYNIINTLNSIKSFGTKDISSQLSFIMPSLAEGYEHTLTPNGGVKHKELEHLLTLDSDLTFQLGRVKLALESNKEAKIDSLISILKDLVSERKKFVNSLKV